MRAAVVAWLLAGTLSAFACGVARLPAPPVTRQPTSALEPVPYPPPPARAERVPERPDEDAVWIDGEWIWESRRWAWKPGRWVFVPRDARFAPWTTVRDATGSLFLASGVFRDADGGALPDPRPLAVARARTGALVDPEGDRVIAPTLPMEGLDRSDAGRK